MAADPPWTRHPPPSSTPLTGRPPLTALSPFSTLFRSTTGLEPATSAVTGRRSNQLNYVPASAASLRLPHELRKPEDRKSTRLNSSHLVISYAVFCLKKKKRRHYTRNKS